jgi:NADPH2:quinone reductase
MRAIICETWRDFDALEVKDVPRPALRPRSVRIKVAAAGVSFATQLVVAGKYQRKPPLPFTPGTEIVGTVLEAAPNADAPPPGTRVFAVVDWGGMAEEAIADDIHTIAIPDGLPLEPAIQPPARRYCGAAGSRQAIGCWCMVRRVALASPRLKSPRLAAPR